MLAVIVNKRYGTGRVEFVEIKFASVVRHRFEGIITRCFDVDIAFPDKTIMAVNTCRPYADVGIGTGASLHGRKGTEVGQYQPAAFIVAVC